MNLLHRINYIVYASVFQGYQRYSHMSLATYIIYIVYMRESILDVYQILFNYEFLYKRINKFRIREYKNCDND